MARNQATTEILATGQDLDQPPEEASIRIMMNVHHKLDQLGYVIVEETLMMKQEIETPISKEAISAFDEVWTKMSSTKH